MSKIRNRFWLTLFSLFSFLGYFGAVFATEHTKQATQIAEAKAMYLRDKSTADEARYQYYQDVTQKKTDLKQAMADAQAQYDQLLKDQPGIVAKHQTTQTITTQVPVTTEATKPSTASKKSSNTSSSTSTRKTKTS